MDDGTEDRDPDSRAAVVQPQPGPGVRHGAAGQPATAAQARAAVKDAEAMAVVVGASWPVGARPSAVERWLASAVRPCLDRGHLPGDVFQAMTRNLDGARNPVAVTRLRGLAVTEPAPPPALREAVEVG